MVGQLRQRGERRLRILGSGAVMVLALVGDDEHRRLAGVSLHVLPRRAPAHRAALVVAAARTHARIKFKYISWSVAAFIDRTVMDRYYLVSYRGYGEPLMGFWPYLRHE